MKRYSVSLDASAPDSIMDEDPKGEYVEFSEVEVLLAELNLLRSSARTEARPSIVTEDPLFYYVHTTPGTVHVQRKRPLRTSDNPLSSHEETIILLCRAMSEPQLGEQPKEKP